VSDNEEPKVNAAENDDVYVIDDTGESLEEYSAEISTPDDPSSATQASGEPAVPEEVHRENQTLKDQLLRSRADFDNFRKRVEKEKADYFKHALNNAVRELLPVLDNFERALAHETADSEFKTGVEMIYKQMSDAMQKLGVREVASENAMFDPTVHEAVMREETETVPSHTVLQVLQKGYTLNDRLLRPALVKVAVGGPERDSNDEGKA
jgi:molecular chaperone GrpE